MLSCGQHYSHCEWGANPSTLPRQLKSALIWEKTRLVVVLVFNLGFEAKGGDSPSYFVSFGEQEIWANPSTRPTINRILWVATKDLEDLLCGKAIYFLHTPACPLRSLSAAVRSQVPSNGQLRMCAFNDQ